jgi:hypothetical protein
VSLEFLFHDVEESTARFRQLFIRISFRRLDAIWASVMKLRVVVARPGLGRNHRQTRGRFKFARKPSMPGTRCVECSCCRKSGYLPLVFKFHHRRSLASVLAFTVVALYICAHELGRFGRTVLLRDWKEGRVAEEQVAACPQESLKRYH